MKVSYKILKQYLPYIGDAYEVANKLIMHTAEVEEVLLQAQNLKDVFIGEIISCKKHPESDKLNICQVFVKDNPIQIICGADNVKKGLKVAVALPGSVLGEDFIIQETKIRGEISQGMICSLDELDLIQERQKGIWELPKDAIVGMNLAQYLDKNDLILNIDNKAINHRPDLFSYIGILREIATIYSKELNLNYKKMDFSNLDKLQAKNEIPNEVKRYSLLKISGVSNVVSNKEIKTVIEASGHSVKGLLVDITNYSLYFYGQPAHIFDADKIEGNITIRFAKDNETLEALDDKIYTLTSKDIVIADDKKVLALGGIIGGKNSCVCENTKNIFIETAHFDQAILRQTGKRLGIRTDALNVFEKDILPDLASYATSLIVYELQKEFPNLKLISYFDSYEQKQQTITQKFDLNFYNNLIGANYQLNYVENILKNLGITKIDDKLIIPFWRKELTQKADIAEEIARIDGYNNIKSTIPRINLGAIIQTPIYNLKNDSKTFFSHRGFFEVYNSSFVGQELLEKLNLDINTCVGLKNSLTQDTTHLRNTLIPNLMKGLQDNIKDKKNIKLFEIEKVFFKENDIIKENYYLSGVITSNKNIAYYDIQNILIDFLKTIFVDNFYFDTIDECPLFAHLGRTANLIIRGQKVGIVGEIHPNIANKFDVESRIGFFEIDCEKLLLSAYNIVKVKELSIFQENNFDLSFVVDKSIKGKDIKQSILNTDKKIINKVELFDIYEDEEKLPGKRSLSFKVYIQSNDFTITDDLKQKLILEIIKKVSVKGGVLRQ